VLDEEGAETLAVQFWRDGQLSRFVDDVAANMTPALVPYLFALLRGMFGHGFPVFFFFHFGLIHISLSLFFFVFSHQQALLAHPTRRNSVTPSSTVPTALSPGQGSFARYSDSRSALIR
jgi:hypothetical protein